MELKLESRLEAALGLLSYSLLFLRGCNEFNIMTKYGMTTPQCESVYDENPKWLEEKMLCGDPDFWLSGSGEARVEWGARTLDLVFHEQFGFTLLYTERNDLGRWQGSYAPWMKEEFGRPVEIWVGGNPLFRPEAEFVSRELAFEVVKEFCEKGTRSCRIRWIEPSGVSWDSNVGKPIGAPPSVFAPNDERDLHVPQQEEIDQVILGTNIGWMLKINPDGSAEVLLANWNASTAYAQAKTFDFNSAREDLLRASVQLAPDSNSCFVTFVRPGQQSFGSQSIHVEIARKYFQHAFQSVTTKEEKFDELLRDFPPN